MDERSPLLQFPGMSTGQSQLAHLGDHHMQFCHLVGVRPATLPPEAKHDPHPDSLYMRALKRRTWQGRTYAFTAALINTLLLSQVVLGAALTGLGASDSSRVLITVFGALNTVIAGLIAFLKSRGQPFRARMFRDDLDRVVDEIENSATMWLGISRNVHGYDAIDTDDAVTVRSEIARLTRLYDRAVKTNTMNDPDMYAAGTPGDPHMAALKAKPAAPAPSSAPTQADSTPAAVPLAGPTAPIAADPDDSPATKAPDPTPPPPPPPKDTPAPAAAAPAAPPAPESKPIDSGISTPLPDKPSFTDSPPKPAESTPSPPPAKEEPAQPQPPAADPAPASPPAPLAQPPVQPAEADEDPDSSPATAAHPVPHSRHPSREGSLNSPSNAPTSSTNTEATARTETGAGESAKADAKEEEKKN